MVYRLRTTPKRLKQMAYVYGVKLDEQSGLPVIFLQKKGLPPGTLWHDTYTGTSAQALALAKRRFSTRSDWSKVTPVTAVKGPAFRTYVYGLVPKGSSGWESFCLRKEKALPERAFSLREYHGTGREALVRAAELCPTWEDLDEAHGRNEELTVEPPIELGPGVVICHVDPDGQHMGILLRERSSGEWFLVFFTSNPLWGVRRATTDELALAAFSSTKRTYLVPVTRSSAGLIPTQAMFPLHRVEALVEEFGRGRSPGVGGRHVLTGT